MTAEWIYYRIKDTAIKSPDISIIDLIADNLECNPLDIEQVESNNKVAIGVKVMSGIVEGIKVFKTQELAEKWLEDVRNTEPEYNPNNSENDAFIETEHEVIEK